MAEPGLRAHFGHFEFDRSSGELRKYGVRIPLEDHPFRILSMLLAEPGALISRTAIKDELWGEAVFLNHDHGINKAINKLRVALGDSIQDQRFIQTQSRRGYRFVADVQLSQPANAFSGGEPDPQTKGGKVSETLAPPGQRDFDSAVAAPLQSARAEKVAWRSKSFAVGMLAGIAVAAILFALEFVYKSSALDHMGGPISSAVVSPTAVNSVFIQKSGALDPMDEGFKLHQMGTFAANVLRNPNVDGFDRWKLSSDDSTYYYRTLSEPEKVFAARNNWSLTCVCSLVKGTAFADVDFGRNGSMLRFDIMFLEENGKFFVGLTRKISPVWEFDRIEFRGVSDVDHPHTYQLRYNHLSNDASLWVDGKLAISGYRGVDQYMEDRGLFFGSAATIHSRPGIGIFRNVRFEAY